MVGSFLLKLFAQIFEVGIDKIERVGRVHGIAAEVLGNGFFGEHAVGVGQQVEEQVVFFAGEGQWFAAHQHLGLVGPHQQVAEHDVVLPLKLPPPDDSPQAGVQFR